MPVLVFAALESVEPPITVDDEIPCLPGVQPLWHDGPALPRWIELEAARFAVPEEPPSEAQVLYLRALGAEVPISKGEAGALLTRLVRARKRARAS